MAGWLQLWVSRDGVTAEEMRKIDAHLRTIGAVTSVPHEDGLPVKDADGTWEIRQYTGDMKFLKYILTDYYGFKIEREKMHGETVG